MLYKTSVEAKKFLKYGYIDRFFPKSKKPKRIVFKFNINLDLLCLQKWIIEWCSFIYG